MDKKPLIAQGWLRVIIFIIVGLILSAGFSFTAKKLLPQSFNNLHHLVQFLFAYAINFAGFIVAAFLLRLFVDKKSIVSLGFGWKGNEIYAFTGFFTAIFILCGGSLILMALNYLQFTDIAISKSNLVFGGILFIVVALIEEIIFRGYILCNLLNSLSKWPALLLSSLLFALLHAGNPSAGILPIINIFVAGILLGINYIYTKNLWFGVFLHFGWNYLQGPLLGYEVSGFKAGGLLQQIQDGPALITGGNFGFEGSLVCLVLELLMIGILAWKYNKSN